MSEQSQITLLLRSAAGGDSRAASELLPLVYAELRAAAQSRMGKIPPGQTLQPTALVHEAYIRVLGGRGDQGETFENRNHFFFVAARAMRDILVEQARHKATLKKGGDKRKVSAENLEIPLEAPAEDMLALDEALGSLERDYPRKHQVVMLKYFVGMTAEEVAELLGVARKTVERDWRFAKAHLRSAMGVAGHADV